MSDVQSQLRSYVERRINGSSARAQAMVASTVKLYEAAVKALERFGSSSRGFWNAIEVGSLPQLAVCAAKCDATNSASTVTGW